MDDNLVTSIADFVEKTCSQSDLNTWLKKNYLWPNSADKRTSLYKKFNEDFTLSNSEARIAEDDTDCYEKTSRIKQFISKSYGESKDIERTKELVIFFISKWGGIDRIGDETIAKIIRTRADMTSPEDRFYTDPNKKGKKHKLDRYNFAGISSWSKYLSIANPKWAHIYDSRIAYSLNALIYINDLYDCNLWMMPDSRNRKLTLFDIVTLISVTQAHERLLSNYQNVIFKSKNGAANFKKKYFVKKNETYPRYLEILANVKQEINVRKNGNCTDEGEIEAFLFAIADDELFKEVINKSLG